MAPPRIVVQNADRLRDRYLAGASLPSLACEAGVSVGTVRRALVEAGVTIRGRGASRPPRPLDDATIADLAAAYRAGASRYQLMTRVGDSNYKRVDAALAAAGVEIRNDKTRRGAEHPRFTGGPASRGGRERAAGDGRATTADGYVWAHAPDDWPWPEMLRRKANGNGGSRRILEHRMVMAVHLGRALSRRDIVHHRNGVRSDNRIENLELWATAHPPGQRAHEHGVCPCCGERLVCPKGHEIA